MEGRKRGRRPKQSKRTKEQRAYDLVFCSERFLKGWSYKEITDALNEDLRRRGLEYQLTMQQIFYDIKDLLIEWKRQHIDNIDEYIVIELRKLDKIEAEAWKGWERSQQSTMKTKSRKSAKDGYKEESEETNTGNPRFLDVLLNVQQRRAKLLGFDAPQKIDISGTAKEQESDAGFDISDLPDALIIEVANKLQDGERMKILKAKEDGDNGTT